MKKILNIVLLALFIFISFAVLYPNPYGNNPDAIQDESYFLTSSLSGIEKFTLPGWEFSSSGTYYGGPQTYVDTAVLIPVLAAVFVHSHFSLLSTKVWVAINTGRLLHVLRLVSGIAALAALLFCFFFFKKRKIPTQLALSLILFAGLMFSNAGFVQFLHTAKVWNFYTLLVLAVSVFFIANEYFITRLGKPLFSTSTYAAIFVWASILAFFQNYVGILSIALIVAYAIVLKQIAFSDLWSHIKKYWWLIVLISLTQLSFLYRAIFINWLDGSFSNISIKNSQNHIAWLPRLYDPIVGAFTSQPLVWLYVIGVAVVVFFAYSQKTFWQNARRRTYLIIACVHPLIVYFIFHVCIGFSSAPRYAIILTTACAFSTVIIFGEFGAAATKAAIACAAILLIIVNVHAIELYWHPSSEDQLLSIITQSYDTSNTVFIEESSALRLTLPVNSASLALLDQKRADMGRFSFLLQNPNAVNADIGFKPLTMIAYSQGEEQADIARFATSTASSVWVISAGGVDASGTPDLCTPSESAAHACFEVNIGQCAITSQEVNTLPVFLQARELGDCYVAHKIH